MTKLCDLSDKKVISLTLTLMSGDKASVLIWTACICSGPSGVVVMMADSGFDDQGFDSCQRKTQF